MRLKAKRLRICDSCCKRRKCKRIYDEWYHETSYLCLDCMWRLWGD